MNEPTPGPEEGLPPQSLAKAATMVYGLLVCLAVGWLWLRDRQGVLSERAVADGALGALWSLLSGTAVGFGISGVMFLLVRYQPAFTALEGRLQAVVGRLCESEIVAIALASAIGEEMFFRGALQDQVGPYLSAVIFGLLHTGPGLLLWGCTAAVLGLMFSMMVHHGFGLLSVTVAHALINFISLRRMVYR